MHKEYENDCTYELNVSVYCTYQQVKLTLKVVNIGRCFTTRL